MKIKHLLILVSVVIVNTTVSGQDSKNSNEYKKLSKPEKKWVWFHPFIAKKAWILTREVRQATVKIRSSGNLDGTGYGDQIDAFKHSYWMAYLSSRIAWRKVNKLGRAREKGNYHNYKKRPAEENINNDYMSSEMDKWNNNIGIEIGRQNKEIDAAKLQSIIIKSIKEGKMKIIKMNDKRDFLDNENNIIPADKLTGTWYNNKCLIPSNKIF